MITSTPLATILATDTRGTIESEGMSLQIVQRSFARDTDIDAVIAGTAIATSCTATSDGRGYVSEWHEGPEAETVFVERYDTTGRVFHGWVDSASRRIVQTG